MHNKQIAICERYIVYTDTCIKNLIFEKKNSKYFLNLYSDLIAQSHVIFSSRIL